MNNDEILRLNNLRERLTEELRKAQVRYDGFAWLLDRRVDIDNCNYNAYRSILFWLAYQLKKEVREKLLEEIADFPFNYKIEYVEKQIKEGF